MCINRCCSEKKNSSEDCHDVQRILDDQLNGKPKRHLNQLPEWWIIIVKELPFACCLGMNRSMRTKESVEFEKKRTFSIGFSLSKGQEDHGVIYALLSQAKKRNILGKEVSFFLGNCIKTISCAYILMIRQQLWKFLAVYEEIFEVIQTSLDEMVLLC